MPLNIEVLRELTPEDLTAPPVRLPAKPTGLDRVKAIHHAKARLVAQGQRPAQVAAALGVSRTAIESLLEDPTFQELVAYYRDQLDVVYLTTHEEAALLARMAMGELRERLEVNPAKFSDNQLRELAIAMLDRTDLPPKSGAAQAVTAPTITFNFGASTAALEQRAQGLTIEAKALEPTPVEAE